MTWEIKVQDEFERESLAGIVEELVDRLEELDVDPYDENLIDEAAWAEIHDVLDGHFIYNVDQLAAINYYGHISDGMDATWEDLESDIVERTRDSYAR